MMEVVLLLDMRDTPMSGFFFSSGHMENLSPCFFFSLFCKVEALSCIYLLFAHQVDR